VHGGARRRASAPGLISTECAAVQVYQLVSIQRAKQTLKSKEISGRWSGFASSTADPCGIREPLFGRFAPRSFSSKREWDL